MNNVKVFLNYLHENNESYENYEKCLISDELLAHPILPKSKEILVIFYLFFKLLIASIILITLN